MNENQRALSDHVGAGLGQSLDKQLGENVIHDRIFLASDGKRLVAER